MPNRDIIVIGTSAGGVETLSKLVDQLSVDLVASIFIVIHLPASQKSLLPKILSKHTSLSVRHPIDGEDIQPGQIYIAPPDRHLLVKRGYLKVTQGPKENRHRPAIDPLFRSAARAYRNRVIGIVLSGMLDDGTAGLMEVKHQGGLAIAQDPEDALFGSMPQSAIQNVTVDYILPVSEIAPLLADLVKEQVPAITGAATVDETEVNDVEASMSTHDDDGRNGTPSGFVCPECGGTLWELRHGNFLRYRCRTGHAYSGETLLAEQSEDLEAALWNAIRMMEERIALLSKMAMQASKLDCRLSAQRHEEEIRNLQHSIDLIKKALRSKLEVE